MTPMPHAELSLWGNIALVALVAGVLLHIGWDLYSIYRKDKERK